MIEGKRNGLASAWNGGGAAIPYIQVDRVRRVHVQGKLLDELGLGPIETPSRVLLSAPLVTLKAYGEPHPGPVLLIVPAPIKRAYIWDLVPGASVVQRLLASGIQVYLMQWERPGAGAQGMGLAAYADECIETCLERIVAEVGSRRVFLARHSLGGTFSDFTALHAESVQGLVLLGAPLHFGKDAGAFRPLVSAAPRAHMLGSMLGNVPGSFLDLVSVWASPTTFVAERWTDWLASLPEPQLQQLHFRVLRWSLDEMALPRQLFEEVVELLYREDQFARGALLIRGRRAAPELVDAPMLNVIEPRSRVVPPQSVLPFHEAARSTDRQVLWYEGDIGVALQHVGMLVGRHAPHQNLSGRKFWAGFIPIAMPDKRELTQRSA